jgi:predicted O-methyltransferase YrrM
MSLLETRWSLNINEPEKTLTQRMAETRRLFFLLKNHLYKADKIFTQTTSDERDTLFKLARTKLGGIAAEIGSSYGASACFIAAGLRKKNSKLYCVDKWNIEYRQEDGEVINYLYEDDGRLCQFRWDPNEARMKFIDLGNWKAKCTAYAQFLENTTMFSHVIRPVRADSTSAAGMVTEKIDFLFIDGWHEYDKVKADWNAWSKRLASGAIVAFHDSAWAPGVQRVISEDVLPRAVKPCWLVNMFWAVIE